MTFDELLGKLKGHNDTEVEERRLPDGTRVYIVSAKLPYPFPPNDPPRWAVFVRLPGQDDIPPKELEANLRHLWHLQLLAGKGNA